MHLKYLGGKTDHKRHVHVYYLTEFAKVSGWLPDEETLNNWLGYDPGIYTQPALWGQFIVDIR